MKRVKAQLYVVYMKPILNTKTNNGLQQNDREKMLPSTVSQADILIKQGLLNKPRMS